MATQFELQWRTSREIEKEILSHLSQNAIPDVTALLDQYRSACEATVLCDYAASLANSVEDSLWAVHVQVNTKYRKVLGQLKKEASKRAVETRKVSKQYEYFLKSSQRFYRTFVHRLSSRFGGIPELERIAHKLTSDDALRAVHVSVTPEFKQKILISCHQTLIRLGDLHRYRVTELSGTERNWGPAVGFYTLARMIYPASGVPHNQQAVIALADDDNLRATYHLYRALTVQEPHPGAKGNLEIEFKKITGSWSKGEMKTMAVGKDNGLISQPLINWFLLLHAKNYRGQHFSQHDELEDEVMSQLRIDLKERSIDGILHKMVLINTASQYFAGIRLHGDPQSNELLQSYFFFLRLNVRTFVTLLQLLQSDLECYAIDERPAEAGKSINLADKITGTARRLLPALRLYSSWCLTNCAVLAAEVGDTSLQGHVKQLWRAYARTLTLLASIFPAEHLPSVEYLLEEDEDTIGFKPLVSDHTTKIWNLGEKPKARSHDVGIERHHPNIEMLARVRELLVDGLHLTVDDNMPLDLHNLRFIYRETAVPSDLLADQPNGAAASPESTETSQNASLPAEGKPLVKDAVSHALALSEPISLSLSRDVDLNRMVDELVGTCDDLDTTLDLPVEAGGSMPPTPPQHSFLDEGSSNSNCNGPRSESLPTQDPVGKARKPVLRNSPPPNNLLRSQDTSPSPRLQQITARPPLSSIWDPDPSQWSRPGTARRNSPTLATTPHQGHWRGRSGHSSRDSLLVPDTWGSHHASPSNGHRPETPTDFGAVGSHRRGYDSLTHSPRSTPHGHDSTYDHIMGGSLLFGAANGPWSVDSGNRSPLGTM